ATFELVAIFVHGQADEQIAVDALALVGLQLANRVHQHFVCCSTTDSADDVLGNLSDRPRLADGLAALRDYRLQPRRTTQTNNDGSLVHDARRAEDRSPVCARPTRRQSADD